ncbi:MAG: radical SAM protein [Deltaproteobacteria bacterium]|nr:MAG: radical SAM protein [Deltaproteobacteria bacterium]
MNPIVAQGFTRFKVLTLVVTNRCNLRCQYCYQDRSDKEEMTWEIAEPAIDLLLDAAAYRRKEGKDPGTARIVFYGGEPLLNESIIRRSVAHAEAARERVPHISYELLTNGLLLDRAKIGFYVQHGFDLQLSFDGVPEAQNDRGLHTFEKLDRALNLLAEHPRFYRRNLRISLTITSRNIPYLAESIAYFRRKGIARVSIEPVTTFDGGWTPERLDEIERQIEAVYQSELARFRKTGRHFVDNFVPTEETGTPYTPKYECCAGAGSNISVDPYGEMTGCTFFLRYLRRWNMPLLDRETPADRGNVQNLEKAIDERTYERLVYKESRFWAFKHEKHTPDEDCNQCPHKTECHGCPLSAGYIPDNDDPTLIPRWVCRFNKAVLPRRYAFAHLYRAANRHPAAFPVS